MRAPPLSHPDHGLNAMVQDSSTGGLAEHGGRTAHSAEAELPQGKATEGAGCDMELSRMLEALPALSPAELRSEWRRLYRSQAPRLSRDLLIRGVAHRLQELDLGGMSKATRRKLAAFATELEASGSLTPPSSPQLRPGARLVREWRGRTHIVAVLEDGFEYAGKAYPSLTRIAQTITGAHWSGPRFFGLTNKRCSAEPSDKGAEGHGPPAAVDGVAGGAHV